MIIFAHIYFVVTHQAEQLRRIFSIYSQLVPVKCVSGGDSEEREKVLCRFITAKSYSETPDGVWNCKALLLIFFQFFQRTLPG